MQATHDRQKSYPDLKHKPMEFQVKDKVVLKVLAKVGDVAYKLELPQELSRVRNTFRVSKLKKCYFDKPLAIPLDGLHIDFCRRTCRNHRSRSQMVEAKPYPNCQGLVELQEGS
ncbi:hypothetical protein Tco_1172216 [Tanacetum coccineum]